MSKHYFIVAGEASGDLLGAELCQQIKQHDPHAQFSGMAGPQMRHAGVDALVDAETMSIVGIWEVLKHLPKIRRVMRRLQLALLEHKPDVLILIDYPGFNLRLAKFASQHGIKVFYYVSPQIWAWRAGRIKTIKQNVDHMAVLFQFERDIYRKAGVPVTLAGHPLRHMVPSNLEQHICQQQLKLDTSQQPIIGLMPGSRIQEISRLLPTLLESATQLMQRYPRAQFLLPIADSLDKSFFTQLPDNIHCITNNTYAAIKACDAVICASGTATLEVSLLQVPMVLVYKVAPLSYVIGKRLIKTPYIGLCNIVAEEPVCEELIQDQANADNITTATIKCLEDKLYRQTILSRMAQTRQRLGAGVKDQALLDSLLSYSS